MRKAKLYLKLLSIIPKAIQLAQVKDPRLKELAKRFKRSCQLVLFDENEEVKLWVGFGDEGNPVVKLGEYPATNTVRMHIDVFLDILNGKLDFRTAFAHGLIQVLSHDGKPVTLHFMLWSSWFDYIRQLVTGQSTSSS